MEKVMVIVMQRVRLWRRTVVFILGVIVIERMQIKVEFQYLSWSILVKKSLVRKKMRKAAHYIKGGGED